MTKKRDPFDCGCGEACVSKPSETQQESDYDYANRVESEVPARHRKMFVRLYWQAREMAGVRPAVDLALTETKRRAAAGIPMTTVWRAS